jgi:hypothetical protein
MRNHPNSPLPILHLKSFCTLSASPIPNRPDHWLLIHLTTEGIAKLDSLLPVTNLQHSHHTLQPEPWRDGSNLETLLLESTCACKYPKGNKKQDKSLASLSPFCICLSYSESFLQSPWILGRTELMNKYPVLGDKSTTRQATMIFLLSFLMPAQSWDNEQPDQLWLLVYTCDPDC